MYVLDLERVDRRVSAEIPARAVAIVNGAKTADGEPLEMPSHAGERRKYWELLTAEPPKPQTADETALREALGLE
jgi:hypothetical protein